MERVSGAGLCSFLLALLVACWEANAGLQCACNVGDGRCRANNTCVPSTSYGLCLRLHTANSVSSQSAVEHSRRPEPLLSCTDDADDCLRSGATCCRDPSSLCNRSPSLGSSEYILERRVLRSVTERRRRKRWLQISLLDGVVHVPPPNEGKVRCLCHDPITTSIGCRLSHSNKSVCTLADGGWCARSWAARSDGTVEIRDSCVPKSKEYMCSRGHQIQLKCCSNRKLCQPDLQPPVGFTPTARPGAGTTVAYAPAGSSLQSPSVPEWNSTWMAGGKLRCHCNSGSNCNTTTGWCATDGLCYSYQSSVYKLTKCVSSAEAPLYRKFCKDEKNRQNLCCANHCCNNFVDNETARRRCQQGQAIAEIPSDEASTNASIPAAKPQKFHGAKVCHCSGCPGGFCTTESGVCSVEVDVSKGLTFRGCVSPRDMILHCKRRHPETIHRVNMNGDGAASVSPVHCCATDKCNLCHPHVSDVPCQEEPINCSCTTCGNATTCPLLEGHCYSNKDNTEKRCIGPLEATLCSDGTCCNESMCNSHAPLATAPATKLPPPTTRTTNGSSKTAEGTISSAADRDQEDTGDGSGFSDLLIIVLAVCAALVVTTIAIVLCVLTMWRGKATTKCQHAVQTCNGKTKSTPPGPPKHDVASAYARMPQCPLSAPSAKMDDRSNTPTRSNRFESDSHSNTSSTVVDCQIVSSLSSSI